MKVLERVQFKANKFDPKTSRGADNVRSFYKADQGYVIEFDPDAQLVRVSCNGRHNVVPLAEVLEMRESDDGAAGALPALLAPKTVAVKLAEGAYAIRPKAAVAEPEEAPLPPRKRGPGRPPKAAVSAQ